MLLLLSCYTHQIDGPNMNTNTTIATRGEQEMHRNLAASRSHNTINLYRRAGSAFVDKTGPRLPADPTSVAVYLSELGSRTSPANVRLHAAAINAAHVDAGLQSPTRNVGVKKVIAGHVRRTKHVPQQTTGLDAEAWEAITETAMNPRVTHGGRMERTEEAQFRGLKDVCLIGMMRDALLRRSEVTELTWSDFVAQNDGTGRLLIRYSKTDQEGKGSVRYISEAVTKCLMDYQIMKGAGSSDSIFGLSSSQVSRRIGPAAKQAGLVGSFTGDSPRVGMAIDLSRAGVSLPALMEAGRWKNSMMPARIMSEASRPIPAQSRSGTRVTAKKTRRGYT